MPESSVYRAHRTSAHRLVTVPVGLATGPDMIHSDGCEPSGMAVAASGNGGNKSASPHSSRSIARPCSITSTALTNPIAVPPWTQDRLRRRPGSIGMDTH